MLFRSSETCCNALLKAREEAKLARQRRIEIEKECREIIKLLKSYQNQFKEVFEQYFHETTKFFNQSFDELERALYAGDADLAIAVAGYGVKKGIDALDADCEADEFIKKAESLKEEATKKAESAHSDCKLAFARFGEKKLRVLSHSVSNFLDHFHRLKRSRITIEGINMQDIQRQVSDARNLLNQLNANGIDGDSAPGVIAGCVGLGASGITTGAILGGGLEIGRASCRERVS